MSVHSLKTKCINFYFNIKKKKWTISYRNKIIIILHFDRLLAGDYDDYISSLCCVRRKYLNILITCHSNKTFLCLLIFLMCRQILMIQSKVINSQQRVWLMKHRLSLIKKFFVLRYLLWQYFCHNHWVNRWICPLVNFDVGWILFLLFKQTFVVLDFENFCTYFEKLRFEKLYLNFNP